MKELVLKNVDEKSFNLLKELAANFHFDMEILSDSSSLPKKTYQINGTTIIKGKKDFSSLDLVSDIISKYGVSAKELREKGWSREK